MESTIVTLKVGDKTFYASETNLRKSEYFNSLLTRWNHKEEIILDDDVRLFRHFLNCLRYDNYQVPYKYQENVTNLLDYYGVKYDKMDIKKAVYLTKICDLNPTKNKIKFNGKFADILLETAVIITLKIIFNGTIIFNGALDVPFKKLVKTNTRYSCINKEFIDNINNLEGDFEIEVIFPTNSLWCRIIYFKKNKN